MFVSFESHLIIAGGQIMICFFAPPSPPIPPQVPDDSGLIQLDVRA